jgi:hypothetical protein
VFWLNDILVSFITVCIQNVDLCFVTTCSLWTLVFTYKDLRGSDRCKRDTLKRLSKLSVLSFSHIICSPTQSLFHHRNNPWISQWHFFFSSQILQLGYTAQQQLVPWAVWVQLSPSDETSPVALLVKPTTTRCVRTAVNPTKHLHLCCQSTPCCLVY